MNSQRTFAKLTGYSLIAMAIIAGFSYGFVFNKVYDSAEISMTLEKLLANFGLYKLMLMGFLCILILDIIVSWALYKFFQPDSRKLSWYAALFRISYTIIFGYSLFFLTKNLYQQSENSIVVNNLNSFLSIWAIGLIIFGFHIIAVGFLMKRHDKVPAILWIITIIGGISYCLANTLKVALPDQTELTTTIDSVLALPMAAAELGLAFWLLFRGGK